MAAIPCEDFYNNPPPVVPTRLKCADDETCLLDRNANFIYCFDLSAEPGDEQIGEASGGWALWDLPTSLAAQIDTPFGEDLITVAIGERIYYLDWDSHTDEWEPNVASPIYRKVEFAPIPHGPKRSPEEAGYSENVLKRFREFWFVFAEELESITSRVRITVSEWENPTRRRQGTYLTSRQVDAKLALTGTAFAVRIEHASDEPFVVRSWQAEWDLVGSRVKTQRRG